MSKKSFLLMRDLLETVALMTDEEAGQIFKSIIQHVDDQPVTLSRELNFAFIPIKNQLSRDLQKYDDFVEKQRRNGALGGRPKKPKTNPKNPSLLEKTQANPNNLDTVTVTDNVTDIKTRSNGFDQFWLVYPKKVKKKDAFKKWGTMKLDSLAERIVRDIENRKLKDDRWKSGYVPDPTTYLNGERWNDEIETTRKSERLPIRGDCNAWVKFAATHGITAKIGESQNQFESRIKHHIGVQ